MNINQPLEQIEKIHYVQIGDNMEKIARKYGFTSWQLIFYDKRNESLRKQRSSPNRLVPGDKIIIPPDPILMAQIKLEKFKQI